MGKEKTYSQLGFNIRGKHSQSKYEHISGFNKSKNGSSMLGSSLVYVDVGLFVFRSVYSEDIEGYKLNNGAPISR
jgi:hypothetical protein